MTTIIMIIITYIIMLLAGVIGAYVVCDLIFEWIKKPKLSKLKDDLQLVIAWSEGRMTYEQLEAAGVSADEVTDACLWDYRLSLSLAEDEALWNAIEKMAERKEADP